MDLKIYIKLIILELKLTVFPTLPVSKKHRESLLDKKRKTRFLKTSATVDSLSKF